jgi:hypothetical protein
MPAGMPPMVQELLEVPSANRQGQHVTAHYRGAARAAARRSAAIRHGNAVRGSTAGCPRPIEGLLETVNVWRFGFGGCTVVQTRYFGKNPGNKKKCWWCKFRRRAWK